MRDPHLREGPPRDSCTAKIISVFAVSDEPPNETSIPRACVGITPKVVIGDAVGGGLAHRSPLRSERRLCAEVQVNLEERSTASNAGNQELKNLAQNSFRQPCFAKDI
jgi:hypothetical protein